MTEITPKEREWAEQDRRIAEVVGTDQDGSANARWLVHLAANLTLPLEVTGSEDFRWEEPYVLGVYSQREYQRLKKTRPSYRDTFALESIKQEADSEWVMFREDIGAEVMRKADGLRFVLGLSELRAVGKKSKDAQLLDDYASWMTNYR